MSKETQRYGNKMQSGQSVQIEWDSCLQRIRKAQDNLEANVNHLYALMQHVEQEKLYLCGHYSTMEQFVTAEGIVSKLELQQISASIRAGQRKRRLVWLREQVVTVSFSFTLLI